MFDISLQAMSAGPLSRAVHSAVLSIDVVQVSTAAECSIVRYMISVGINGCMDYGMT